MYTIKLQLVNETYMPDTPEKKAAAPGFFKPAALQPPFNQISQSQKSSKLNPGSLYL